MNIDIHLIFITVVNMWRERIAMHMFLTLLIIQLQVSNFIQGQRQNHIRKLLLINRESLVDNVMNMIKVLVLVNNCVGDIS